MTTRWRFKVVLYRTATNSPRRWGAGVNRYSVPIGVYIIAAGWCLSFVWRYAP